MDGNGHLAEPGKKGRGKGTNGYANGQADATKLKAAAPKLKQRRRTLFSIPTRSIIILS